MHRDLPPEIPPDADHQEPWSQGRNVIVTIGINDYQQWPRLDNAVPDARSVHKLFVETLGFIAPFEPLLNKEATRDAIWDLVKDRLRRYLEADDSLLLFFAGHGHPHVAKVGDRDVETGYIAPVEARRDDDVYYGDLIEIGPLLDAINRLRARHILVVLDSCYSGFALGQTVRRHRGPGKYERRLSRLVSRQVITSANRDERALDSGPIPGNSLFTGALIDGLRSRKADRGNKEFVTSSDLGSYVQKRVIEEAEPEKQTPRHGVFGLDAGGEMVIAFRLEDAKEHYQLGRCLYDMGRMLDDEGRFGSAIRHFDEAIRLSPQPLPVAHLGRGQASLALGKYEEAAEHLRQAVDGDGTLAEAWLYLGVAHAKRGEDTEAVQALEAYLAREPEGDWAPWASELTDRFPHRPTGAKHALLVGIGHYLSRSILPLRGPGNDVQLMQEILVERYEFSADHIRVLLDAQATREGILSALRELEQTSPDDIVVFYYSGHSGSGDDPTYLYPFDAVPEKGVVRNAISAEELHETIRRIGSKSKTLILDTHVTDRFVELAREQTDYTVFLATSPDRETYEFTPPDGDETKHFGLFTYALAHQLEELPPDATHEEILERTQLEMRKSQNPRQGHPQFFGYGGQPFLGERRSAELVQFDLCQRWGAPALTLNQLHRRYESIRGSLTIRLPQLHYSFGHTLLEKGGYSQAMEALRIAVEQAGARAREALLALGVAQLRLQRYLDAQQAFKRYLETAPEAKERMEEPLVQLEKLLRGRKHALVVGIDAYGDRADVRGAINDARAMERILKEEYGFQETDVKVLVNGQATKQAVLDAFEDLVGRAREEPAVFYFAGAGAIGADGAPEIVLDQDGSMSVWVYFGRSEHWVGSYHKIGLRELAEMVGTEPTNLVTVIDAGWARSAVLPWGLARGSRFAHKPDYVPKALAVDASELIWSAWEPDADWAREREQVQDALASYRIGRLSIYQASIRSAFGAVWPLGGEMLVEAELEALDGGKGRAVHGVLTHRLVTMLRAYARMRAKGQELQDLPTEDLPELGAFLRTYTQKSTGNRKPEALYEDTYALLAAFLSHRLQWLHPFVLGDSLDERVFSNSVLEERVHAAIRRRFLVEPVQQAASRLQDLTERQDGAQPEDYLDLGIAYAALGDEDQAVNALQEAVERMGEPCPEAHYYLGRTLFERRGDGDLDGAATQLKLAVDQAPRDARAHYYRAETRRIQAEQDLLVEAAKAYQEYLDLGAPLGRADEVRQILGLRQGERQGSGATTGDVR